MRLNIHHVKKNKGKAGLDRLSIRQFERDLEMNMVNGSIKYFV